MDQIKIGKFIAERRKAAELTQMQLAEKLNITDRAVSKWENGRAMPDSSIMLLLCDILKISVNDLLHGEVTTMDSYNEELEKTLLEMLKEKEKSDKRLLFAEVLIGLFSLIPLIPATIITAIVSMAEWIKVIIVFSSIIPLLIALPFLIKIEQKAGYYECGKCGHRYIPTYKSVFMSMHMGRTRHMRCPNCNEKSWQKKKITKD